MPDNPLLQWTLDAKRALQQAEQLSSHANKLVSDSAAALDTADSLIPKCLFLHEALRGQVVLLQRLGEGCYSVEENARREFEVRRLHVLGQQSNGRSLLRSWIP
jgi:hypothetical protein